MGLEAAGLAVILADAVITGFTFLRDLYKGAAKGRYRRYRARLGRGILLELELLVAADIVSTVVAPLHLQSVAALGLIVLIRTLLSLLIEVEINGRWPWQPEPAPPARRDG